MKSNPTPEQIKHLRQQHIGRLFLRAHHAFAELAFEKLHERGYVDLSTVHTNILPHLDIEGTNVTTLAERAGMTKQAMGRLVDELEAKGYLLTMPDPVDGRAKLVQFTEAGWRFLKDAYEIKMEIEAIYTEILGAEAMAQLRDSLEKLVQYDMQSAASNSQQK